jgi:hypothetical protein
LLFRPHGEPLGPQREINRRMANLLSSARLYVEQVPKDLAAIYGKSSRQPGDFRHSCAQQRASFAYRAMNALRDYAQHSGIPVHDVLHRLTREGTAPGSLLRAGLHLFVDVQRLADDPKFDQRVLDELKRQANRYGCVGLTPWGPEYREKLCKVHESLRDRISAEVVAHQHRFVFQHHGYTGNRLQLS